MKYLERIYHETNDENRRAILAAMPPRRSSRLLDLGCGDGEWTMEVARHVGAGEILGVEFVEDFARLAREAGVEAVVADLGDRLPYEDASIDVIHSNQVIEHLPRTDTFLREISRILAPDGYAVVSTNNLSSWHNILSLTFGWQPAPCHVSDEAILGNPVHSRTDPSARLHGPRARTAGCASRFDGRLPGHGWLLPVATEAGSRPGARGSGPRRVSNPALPAS
jgi:SAM-dependent methyltransferase